MKRENGERRKQEEIRTCKRREESGKISATAFVLTSNDETVYELKTQLVPRSKHSALVIKTDKLIWYSDIIAVCSEIHAKDINALWAEHGISVC